MISWWIHNTLLAALLTGIMVLASRLFRLSPPVRHALWLVVLVRLLMPPMISFTLPAIEIPQWWTTPSRMDAPIAAIEPKAAADQEVLPLKDVTIVASVQDPVEGRAEDVISEPPVELTESADVPVPAVAIDFADVVMLCWLAGLAVLAILDLSRTIRFRRWLARGVPAADWLTDEIRSLAGQLGIRPPRAVEVRGLTTPLVWGVVRPMIVWPDHLTARITPEARRAVLVHELAHLRRRDHWVGALEMVAGWLWYWNPLFWYVRRQLRDAAEEACDAWVIARLSTDRKLYAEALLEVTINKSLPVGSILALGMGRGSKQNMERRLTMILNGQVRHKLSFLGVVVMGLLSLAILPSFIRGQERTAVDIKSLDEPATIISPDASRSVIEATPRTESTNAVEQKTGQWVSTYNGKNYCIEAEKVQTLWRVTFSLLPDQAEVLFSIIKDNPGVTAESVGDGRLIITAIPEKIQTIAQLISYFGVNSFPAPAPVVAPIPAGKTFVTREINIRGQMKTITADNIEILSCATYKLVPDKAKSISARLKENHDVEAKVNDNKLVIITTPDKQSVISQLISLIVRGNVIPAEAPRSEIDAVEKR